ncbi:MAG: hypothetical protein QOF11_2416 [Chloroflexota bacterium]|nr:hypothetical protein [Chloroflexota bacterium]
MTRSCLPVDEGQLYDVTRAIEIVTERANQGRGLAIPKYVCSFAETVHHLHFHLRPRYADMPGLGPELVPALFSEQRACSVEEAEEPAARVRSSLSNLDAAGLYGIVPVVTAAAY